jgi:hypothetical protein
VRKRTETTQPRKRAAIPSPAHESISSTQHANDSEQE